MKFLLGFNDKNVRKKISSVSENENFEKTYQIGYF